MKILKNIDIMDWICLGIIGFFCFICYQHADILHTGGSSIAYLNGHILDFYDYNAAKLGGNNYMPTTYILFAIWNIPVRILGLIQEPTMQVGILVRMWYKLGTFVLYLAVACLIYKICLQQAASQKRAVLAAFLFLSSPIAVYSELIFGQYDIITTFFMCLGYFYYLKDNRKGFVMAFSVALTCKYFALLVFLPLLLLKEKDILKIIRDILGVVSLFLIEAAVYITSDAFRTGVFGFEAPNYIFAASFDVGFAKISLVVLVWVFLCVFAYFKQCDVNEYFVWSIYLSCGVMYLCFGLSMWHPQWVLLAVPFLTLGIVFHQKTDIYLLLDLLVSVLFIFFCVNQWPCHLDQNLFTGGIFGRFVYESVGANMTMSDLLIFKDRNLIFSAFSAVLLSGVLFMHPKYMDCSDSCRPYRRAVLRLRYIGGCGLFIIPSVICLMINLYGTKVIYASGQEMTQAAGVIQDGDVYEQVFEAQKDTIVGIAVQFGTYMQETDSLLKCELVDLETGKVKNEMGLDTSRLEDNQYVKFDFLEPSEVDVGENYSVKISVVSIEEEDKLTLYRTDEQAGGDRGSYAVVNGKKKNYDLSIKVYGK